MTAFGGRDLTDADRLELVRDLQPQLEALFLEARTLKQEVIRLQALHPVIVQVPPRAGLIRRIAMRLVPTLRQHHDLTLVRQSGLFVADWYLQHYPDVRKSGLDPALHFLRHGAQEHRDPGPHFSTAHYLRMYPDIADGWINPLVHYVQAGWREGRAIRPGMRHGVLERPL